MTVALATLGYVGAVIGGIVVLAILGVVALFALAFRGRMPGALRVVRRFNRDVTNVRVLRSAGRAGATSAVLRHRGRVSSRSYATPLGPIPVDGGFEIALPYGPETDWLRNLIAAGSATLEHDGTSYRVHSAEVVPIASTTIGRQDAGTMRAFRVDFAVRLRADPVVAERQA